MKPYLALVQLDLKLALRQKSVLFFNYLFPLLFFVIFGQLTHGGGGDMTQILTMVMVMGVLGNGLFGAGIRAVQERESNILRRYKVTPITPAPLLVASTIVGWLLFMPFVVLIFVLAHFVYGMALPPVLGSIFVFVTLAIFAFRAIGMILAAVANSMQESQIMVQLIYLPMLLLSGATFPAWLFPPWLKIASQFIPATHLVTGLKGMILKHEGLSAERTASLAMLITIALGLFVSFKLFRWEKEEKIRASAKLWIGAVMLPFILYGAWQAHTQQNIARTRALDRQMARTETLLVRNARIVVGDGKVIDVGAVLVRNGKIIDVYRGEGPAPHPMNATVIEAAGLTVLPGLIDVEVHLAAPGGVYADPREYQVDRAIKRALAAYLYSGVMAVQSVGDPPETILSAQRSVNSGERLGAALFTCPSQDVPVEYGSVAFQQAQHEFTRGTGSAAIEALQAGCGKAMLGSASGALPDALFQQLHREGTAYDPRLSSVEAARDFREGKTDLLQRSLAQQVGPAELFDGTIKAMAAVQANASLDAPERTETSLRIASDNLKRAYEHGVTLVTGSGAGNVLVIHGPTVQRELELWVQAGVPANVALQAATYNAARLLNAEDRIGSVRKGNDADLLIVDGNPLQDITVIERVSTVIFKGERISRADLFSQE